MWRRRHERQQGREGSHAAVLALQLQTYPCPPFYQITERLGTLAEPPLHQFYRFGYKGHVIRRDEARDSNGRVMRRWNLVSFLAA